MENVKKAGVRVFMYFIMIFTVILSIFPIIWVIMSAFKTNSQILSDPFSLPTSLSVGIEAFQYSFGKYNFLRYFINSLVICLTSTAVSLVIFAMGGYVIAKFRFPGKNLIFALFTITLLDPAQSKAQPLFTLVMKLNLYDNIWGVALVYLIMNP